MSDALLSRVSFRPLAAPAHQASPPPSAMPAIVRSHVQESLVQPRLITQRLSPPRVAAIEAAVASPLRLGDLIVNPPLLVAPMAGITNAAFREICYDSGAPLCVSEMVTAGTLLQRHRYALKICEFGDREPHRSAQLYGVHPEQVQEAASWLVQSAGVTHLDLNFGCPVRKVTSAGGGAAIPLHPRLLARLVSAAVKGAEGVPVTVKMRMGISKDLLTFREAGRVAQAEGAAGVVLHARTADQLYYPHACWDAISELAQDLQIPVIGNGDIFEAEDAVRMMRETGCAGVMVGRACLGRPWLLQQLQAALKGEKPRGEPNLQEVVHASCDHLQRLHAYWTCETTAVRQMRKFIPLYLVGFKSSASLRSRLLAADTVADWHQSIQEVGFDPTELACRSALRHPRLKGGGEPRPQRIALPDGWLASQDSAESPTSASASECCEG
mmetsp:Transcript_29378/g.82849  ORF Transcript_29378/g.82849 Transcript_29378/m.82849 type:complete len:441 (+) Transcript_29378:82-1404(+)